ncbi:MAG: hydantoinase/oxoprolinase family protein [Archaeoglobi archaeon]|nr:hydantoinase/oxoprolinase family protein [Candidatus Mnemosynella sp.]
MLVGIDVGGTNTDAVIIDDEVHTFKVPNEEGIAAILKKLPEMKNESRIAVSTSLPLNLLLSRAHEYPTLTLLFPGPGLNFSSKGVILRGCVNHRGDVVEEIDEGEIREVLRGSSYDNIAIASKFSTRNSEIEERALEIARNFLPEDSIALSHHCGGMNYSLRINTTVVNAKIKRTVLRLVETIRANFDNFLFFKGDGGLIPYRMALENPSALYNSSPAAVALGAFFLSGESDALVVDIGGTTTDFVMLEKGLPRITENAVILGERTLVRCVSSVSIPYGGDSIVSEGELLPRREGKPLAFGEERPTLTDVLNAEGFEIGDYRISRSCGELKEWDTAEIIDEFVEKIAEKIRSLSPEKVVLGGYLSRYLGGLISERVSSKVIVPKFSEVMNAFGVAVSRISLTLYARFDTVNSRASFNGVIESPPFPQGVSPSEDEIIEEAKRKLLEIVRNEGFEAEEEFEILYFNSYPVVRWGWQKGIIADVIIQLKPGISEKAEELRRRGF